MLHDKLISEAILMILPKSFARLALLLSGTALLVLAQSKPIPQLVKKGSQYSLQVDGKPFIILGGQVNNPTAFPDRMQRAWPKFKALHANTIEFPVYWDSIEPEEGRFDFSGVDEILRGLRQQNLRAILLWFGTWKNGAMDYTPGWVKSNPARFARVIDSGGKPIRVLSPHGQATFEADKAAYTALMRHLRDFDQADRTVILMQVENESGLLGSVRDYSPAATKLYNGPVPSTLVSALKKQPGTWKEVFGARLGEEYFTAYYLSSYIDAIAKAGKEIYPLPAYVNVWMGGDNTNDNFDVWDQPGEGYPSGGPVTHMIDLWKASAPDIDVIGPDIYHQSPIIYRKILSSYHRPDNPLMVVETGGGMNFARDMFLAIAEHSAIGFTPYGVDSGAPTAEISPQFADHAANFRVIGSAVPVIAGLQAAGKLQCAVEEEAIRSSTLKFDNYDILVSFRPSMRASGLVPASTGPQQPSGRVMVGQLGPDEFLIMGFDAALDFRPAWGSSFTGAQFVQVEEGVYEDGVWKRTEIRNGDFSTRGVVLPGTGAMVRVKAVRY
jgi:hypothetical protein